MFPIDFEDKRVKSFLRTLKYAALTILVVGGTILLIYAGEGYDINRQTGEVIQNGLVLVDSSPNGATVMIDGKSETDRTPSKFSLPAGDYDFTIQLDGYRDWRKKVKVIGSDVEWMYYPLLIPKTLKTIDVLAFSNLQLLNFTGNNTMMSWQFTDKVEINLQVLQSSSVIDDQNISLEPTLLSGKIKNGVDKLSFIAWANDNQHLLLRHQAGKIDEYILVDTQSPSLSENLTQEFDLAISDMRFINGDPTQLYGLVGGDLRSFDVQNKQISAPLVSAADEYRLFEDRFVIYLATPKDVSNSVELGLIDGTNKLLLAELPGVVANYDIEFNEYDGTFYLALLNRDLNQTTVYINPQIANDSAQAESSLIFNLDGAKYLDFSPGGRFLEVQSGNKFVTYDFEVSQVNNFKLSYSIPSSRKVKWLDEYRLYANDGDNQLHVFEFDGANDQKLLKSNPDYPVEVGPASEYIYSVSLPTAENTLFLRSTSLVVDSDTTPATTN